MKFKLFPIGYDPMVAAGPPEKYMVDEGWGWTSEDTEKTRGLENEAEIISSDEEESFVKALYRNRWMLKLSDDD